MSINLLASAAAASYEEIFLNSLSQERLENAEMTIKTFLREDKLDMEKLITINEPAVTMYRRIVSN